MVVISLCILNDSRVDRNFFFVEIQKISRAILLVYIPVCYIQNLGQIESLVCPRRSFLYGKNTKIFVLLAGAVALLVFSPN